MNNGGVWPPRTRRHSLLTYCLRSQRPDVPGQRSERLTALLKDVGKLAVLALFAAALAIAFALTASGHRGGLAYPGKLSTRAMSPLAR